MFLPFEINDAAIFYLRKKISSPVYYLVIVLVFLALGSLFFIHVTISVQAPGIIRPAQERTAIRSVVSGIVDSLYVKEGDRVEKEAPILTLRDGAVPVKKQFNEEEILRQKNFIHDLLLIAGNRSGPDRVLPFLHTALYREQAGRFFSQEAEQQLNVKKAEHEATINTVLAKDKVISPKEYFDTQLQQAKMESAFRSFRLQQFSLWQQDLVNCRTKLSELLSLQEEFRERKESCCIRAPVSGVLQGLGQRYAGSSVQPDETICSISPEGQLVAECYVSTRDAGMLRPEQPVRFQIDAFNYNYFGAVSGSIGSVANDYTLVEGKPVFRVLCFFDQQKFTGRKGYRGQLKKGLTFRARFISTTRTLWQLLYDTLGDWINPLSPVDRPTEKTGL